MTEELKVEPAVLTQAANGINSIIGQLSDLGIKETGAMGRGFALLALSPLQAGKASVQSTFETFCNRWSWGVRSLVQSANSLAQSVGLAAGRYQMMDEQAKNALKEVYSHLFSNPHLTKAQTTNHSPTTTWR
ncbi:type VII secretion target [Nocardia niigatensis]